MSNPKKRAAKISQAATPQKTPRKSKAAAKVSQPVAVSTPTLSPPVSAATPAKRGRGRPSKASQAAPKAAPAGSNGDHPKTLAAASEAPTGFILKIGDAFADGVDSIEHAQMTYYAFRQQHLAEFPDLPDAEVYSPQGTLIARIDSEGRAFQLDGKQIGTTPTKADAPAVELGDSVAVTVSARHIAAALSIAAKKDVRHYLNGVYVHTIGQELRIVATDGHRMLVITSPCEKVLPWGEAGVLLPRDELDRISKYIGKGEECAMEISFGVNHQFLKIQEANGPGQFTIKPIDGQFPNYMKIVESAGSVLSSERRPTETNSIASNYLKGAGAIASLLGSDSVFPFIGSDPQDPCVFTFGGEPGALLYVSPVRSDKPAVQAAAVRLIGESGMRGTLAALKAHETRARNAAAEATSDKDRERFTAQASGYQERADEIRAMLSVKLAAPAAPAESEEAGESAEA